MAESKVPARFDISWRDGRYFVSIPNYGGGEVVRADLAGQMAKALRAHDAYMTENYGSDPDSKALHPAASANWKRVREALSAWESAQCPTLPPTSTRSEVTALADIATERQRQREVEGWSSVHDDGHDTGEMAGAAACYALSTIKHWAKDQVIKLIWPWADEWWKPKDTRRNLVKAGALIVAEIERLDRLEGPRP